MRKRNCFGQDSTRIQPLTIAARAEQANTTGNYGEVPIIWGAMLDATNLNERQHTKDGIR